MSNLKDLISPLIETLNRTGTDYAICGNYGELPEYTSNDVDFWAEDMHRFENVLLGVASSSGFKLYLRNVRAVGVNYAFVADSGACNGPIKIDVFEESTYKSIWPLVGKDLIMAHRMPFRNFFVIDSEIESIIHFNYYLLNTGKIREKYTAQIAESRCRDSFGSCLTAAFGEKYSAEILKDIGLGDWRNIEERRTKYRNRFILRKVISLNIRIVWRLLKVLKTGVMRLLVPTGLSVAFIGPDGVGKTTIIKHMEDASKDILIKNGKTFYWRFFLLPPLHVLLLRKKGRTSPTDADGRRKLKRSPVHAVMYHLKFLYYLIDFVFGKLKIAGFYSRGGLVIFDRYYYDNIVYPERFRFTVNKDRICNLARLIYRPDLVFYVNVNGQEVRKRKDELSLREIRKQQEDYNALIKRLPFIRRLDNDGPIDVTMNAVLDECYSFMIERQQKRHF